MPSFEVSFPFFFNVFNAAGRERLALSPSSLCPLRLYPKVSAEMEKGMHEAQGTKPRDTRQAPGHHLQEGDPNAT